MTMMSRNVRLLAWFNFCTDFRPYAPIAILYFAQVSGSYALGMSVYSIVMLAQSFFEVPTGVFSDLIGRRKTIMCGAVASTLSIVLYALGGAYAALALGAVCEGLARAFFSGNNDALLYDTLAENGQQEHFQEYLGKTSSMYQFALAISAFIGSFIASISFTLVMWVSVIPMAVSFVLSFFFIEPKSHSPSERSVHRHLGTAFRSIMHNPRLRTITAASVINFAISESTWLFRSVFVATLWPVWALGIAQMLANASAAVSFYFAGRIIRRFGELRLLLGGISISEAIHVFGMLVPTVFSPALISLTSVFFGVKTVAIGGLLQREFSDEQRATMGSLTSFTGSIAMAVFSFSLGALADRIGVTPALVLVSLMISISLYLYWRGLRPAPAAETVES